MSRNDATRRSSQIGLVMPTYNAETFLKYAVESIQRQTFPDFTCIIVNDGSPDRTAELPQELIYGDPRFSVVHRTNGGIAAARNTGLAHLPMTRYVTFPDSDDIYCENALETLWKAGEQDPDTVGVHGLAEQIDSNGDPLPEDPFADRGRNRCIATTRARLSKVPLDRPSTFGNIVTNCTISPTSTALFRREALERLGSAPYDTTFSMFEDWDVFIRLSRLGDFSFVNEVVVKYRQHGGNITADIPGVRKYNRAVRVKAARSPDNTPAQVQTLKWAWRATEARQVRVRVGQFVRAAGRGRLPSAGRYLCSVGLASCRMLLGKP